MWDPPEKSIVVDVKLYTMYSSQKVSAMVMVVTSKCGKVVHESFYSSDQPT